MDITIHRLPITAWPKCLEILASKSPFLAVASALTMTIVHACARVPRDTSLKVGQRPWCIVAVPDGDDNALEHELRHCEGWAHPASSTYEEARDWDKDPSPGKPFTVSRNDGVED